MKSSVFKKGTYYFAALMFFTVFIGAVSPAVASGSNAVKQVVFEKADYLLQESDTHKTKLYAPKTFEKAMGAYKKADSAYDDGKPLDYINELLTEAVDNFTKALDLCKLGTDVFYDTQTARDSAIKVRASRYRPTEWTMAENTFKQAVSKLEKGEIEKARTMSEEAESLFRTAELVTIKLSYLGSTWKKLEKLESMEGKEYYTPKSYQKAYELALKAEYELERQRYGNDRAKELVKEAYSEADYALKMANFIKYIIDNDKSFEDLIIQAQIPLDLDWEKTDKTGGDSGTIADRSTHDTY